MRGAASGTMVLNALLQAAGYAEPAPQDVRTFAA